MRRPRLKPDDQPLFYHLYNRVAGEPDFLPFGPREKERFVRLLKKLNRFYTVQVVSYQVMSNHFHLVVHVPQDPPEPEEICRRYAAYYDGHRTLDPSSERCRLWGQRIRDISWYMQSLQQQFTRWYNRTRPTRRRGGLWADRFKHTLLGDARAVWECCKYVEMNSVRAGLASNPAEYRFSSYGVWDGTGRHPFEANVGEALLPFLEGQYFLQTPRQLMDALRDAFAGIEGEAARPDGHLMYFTVYLNRRVRYWVDGLVIGSELFMQNIVARYKGALRKRQRGYARARAPDESEIPLYCYKQLRAI